MANFNDSYSLLSLQEVPENFRPLFASYPCFNRVQSAVFNDIIHSNSSMVITAPTGSGKTVIFELAILKLMMTTQDTQSLKIVYVAPVKALCNERFNDWQPRFQAFNMSVVEVTGDSQDHCDLQDHQIIITTPEKWDSLTRRWRDNVSLVQLVKLVMIDEVHLLSDSKRGPILETIVCRMKTVMRVLKLQNSLRFIAVSATIFNIEDLAQWLGTNENDPKFYRFGHEVRPVTLNRVVKGFPQSKSPYLFDIQLSYKLKAILLEYGEGKPALIFCSTRRGVVQTCKTLMENISFNFTREQKVVLEGVAEKLSDGKLKDYVKVGGAYHHAGMVLEDRLAIQRAFSDGVLPVLVATSTLAMGVNLPAHLVVIKSTHQYIAGRVLEYPESSILQMVGRAGRPQFDTTATAVIMTKTEMVNKYQNLLDCKEVIESSLHLQLPEQLNAEIVLLTIFDLSVAMQWIKCTFLYLRALKNPKFYGLSGNAQKIEKDLELIVLQAINALKRSQLIEMNENGLDIAPTPYGRLMSHYYINFNTFQLFFQVADLATIYDLIEILSNSNELSEIQLRVNDKKPLNELNVNKKMETIRFKLDGKIKTRELKINCLVQACLGCLAMDPALQQESIRIINVLERIVKCLTEFLTKKNSYCSLLSSVVLSKCLHAKLWENSVYVARQLDRIGATLGATLVACGKTSFNTLIESHPQELERIVNRGPPFGNAIIEQVRHLPMYSLLVQVDRKSVLNFTIGIRISIINKDLVSIHNTAGRNHSSILIVGDTNNRLLLYKRVFDENIILNEVFEIAVEIKPPMPQKVFIRVVSEQWAGIDVMKDVLVNPMAAIVVGSHCYLPGAKSVKNTKVDEIKKLKSVEEKKQKGGPVLKMVQPVPKKVETRKLSNSENLDNYCCFDLVPDWINNTPSADENDNWNIEDKLVQENDFNDNFVPDVSSPVLLDPDHNYLIGDQEFCKPLLDNSNFPDESGFEKRKKSISTMEYDDSMFQDVDMIPTGKPIYKMPSQVTEDKSKSVFGVSSSIHRKVSFTISEPTEFSQSKTLPSYSENATNSNNNLLNSELISDISSNQVEEIIPNVNHEILSVSGNSNKKWLPTELFSDQEFPTKQLRRSSPPKAMSVKNHIPQNYSETLINSNLTLPSSEIFSGRHILDQFPANGSLLSPSVDNPVAPYIPQIHSENVLISNSVANSVVQSKPAEVCFDLSLPSTPCTVQNEESSGEHFNSSLNKEILTNPPEVNFNLAVPSSENDEVASYLVKVSDSFNLSEINAPMLSDNSCVPNSSLIEHNIKTSINQPKVRFSLAMPKLRISQKEEGLAKMPKIDFQSPNSVPHELPLMNKTISAQNSDFSAQRVLDNYSKFYTNPSQPTVAEKAATHQKQEQDLSSMSNTANYSATKWRFEQKSSDGNLFGENCLISDPQVKFQEVVYQQTHFKSADHNRKVDKSVPVNQVRISTNFKPANALLSKPIENRKAANEIENGVSEFQSRFEFSTNLSNPSSEPISNYFIGCNSTNNAGPEMNVPRHERSENSGYFNISVPNESSVTGKHINLLKKSNETPKKKEKNDKDVLFNDGSLEMSTSSLEISDNLGNCSWQVTEIISPLDLTRKKPPAKNKTTIPVKKPVQNLESLLSQILPQNTLSNVENIDPLDTTSNWVGVEQTLMSTSQSNSKLASFRERFCHSKPKNRPYLSQLTQKPSNLTQESNFAAEKMRMESVPSLKSLFAAAQAAKRRHFN